MGKIKRETALKMVDDGQLSQENFDKMEASGLINEFNVTFTKPMTGLISRYLGKAHNGRPDLEMIKEFYAAVKAYHFDRTD